jgi:hypothetical protein
MLTNQLGAPTQQRFSAPPRRTQPVSPILLNLLRDENVPALAFLAERYGLHRIPGLTTKQAIVNRVLRSLTPQQLDRLTDDLIAARYGALSVDGLVRLALVQDKQRAGRPAPRLDQISPESATLVEKSTGRWIYTMRGHDVLVDIGQHVLACDCGYFRFSARRGALCKHLATVFRLIPEVYSREALINLLVSRQYGGPNTPQWRFIPLRQQHT